MVEGRKVPGFLRVHVVHERAEVRVCTRYGGCLVGVDERCGKLASLIYAEGGVEELLLLF